MKRTTPASQKRLTSAEASGRASDLDANAVTVFTDDAETQIQDAEREADRRQFVSDADIAGLRAQLRR